jgi:2-polyprenyl-3-methyl-5-hydroxy-6-metoxy-1,4-benzoquinol methylase
MRSFHARVGGSLPDLSSGYDTMAERFMSGRTKSRVGVRTIHAWARQLEWGAAVLDLGCGHGVPISQTLIERGHTVYGVDASPTMAEAFWTRFPTAQVACEAVQESTFFERTFDAAVAWGLIFLLPADDQSLLIARVASVLNPGGRFLFTSPRQSCMWDDLLTGRRSLSLGADVYDEILSSVGLSLVGTYRDEGENHYYDALKS